MSITEKEVQIIDLNLFSGSADRFRTALGGTFTTEPVADSDGESLVIHPDFDYTAPASEYLIRAEGYSDTLETISSDVLIPNYRYAVRTYAEPATFLDDKFWKIYWLGGEYGGSQYDGIYNETVWDDYWFKFAYPYTKMEADALTDSEEVTNVLEVKAQYNYYLPEYQAYVDQLDSELLIPNMYLIEMFNKKEAF